MVGVGQARTANPFVACGSAGEDGGAGAPSCLAPPVSAARALPCRHPSRHRGPSRWRSSGSSRQPVRPAPCRRRRSATGVRATWQGRCSWRSRAPRARAQPSLQTTPTWSGPWSRTRAGRAMSPREEPGRHKRHRAGAGRAVVGDRPRRHPHPFAIQGRARPTHHAAPAANPASPATPPPSPTSSRGGAWSDRVAEGPGLGRSARRRVAEGADDVPFLPRHGLDGEARVGDQHHAGQAWLGADGGQRHGPR